MKIAIEVATDLQRTNADIVRVVIAGNSLNETTRDKEATAKAKYLTKVGVIFFENWREEGAMEDLLFIGHEGIVNRGRARSRQTFAATGLERRHRHHARRVRPRQPDSTAAAATSLSFSP